MFDWLLPPWFKICRQCLISLDSRLVWLSEANYMHWSCLLIRTGLDPTPMDPQSVVCTHFAEQYLGSNMYVFVVCVCVCVWMSLTIAYDPNSTSTTILSGSLSYLSHSHRIYLDMCTHTDVCIYLYIYILTHICVCVHMNV